MKKLIVLFMLLKSVVVLAEEYDDPKPINLQKQKAIFDQKLAKISKSHKAYTFKILATYRYEGDPQPYYMLGTYRDSEPEQYLQVVEKPYEAMLILSLVEDDPKSINMMRLEYYDEHGNYDEGAGF